MLHAWCTDASTSSSPGSQCAEEDASGLAVLRGLAHGSPLQSGQLERFVALNGLIPDSSHRVMQCAWKRWEQGSCRTRLPGVRGSRQTAQSLGDAETGIVVVTRLASLSIFCLPRAVIVARSASEVGAVVAAPVRLAGG